MPVIFLIEWRQDSAEQRAKTLRADGWDVEIESEDGMRAYKSCKKLLPRVVVIDLSSKPSHGRETALSLKSLKATKETPVVFVDGEEAAVWSVKAKIPGAFFTTSSELIKVLRRFRTSERTLPG